MPHDTRRSRRIPPDETARHQTLPPFQPPDEPEADEGPPLSMYLAFGVLVIFVCGLLGGAIWVLTGGVHRMAAQPDAPPIVEAAATLIPPPEPEPTPVPVPDYPYIANVTDNARRIFRRGVEEGNHPDVFSKVGDSITVAPQFLTPFGQGNYNLREHTELQPVIAYYSRTNIRDGNPFSYTSLAAVGGWSAFTVVNPGARDRDFCGPNEKPLECEYRIVRPSVALIMLGTNDVATTPLDQYERYMRQVVEISLDRGVVPVLSTVPELQWEDMGPRVQSINNIVKGLSAEYDVPLWDYHAALEGVANQGISDDGVHPSGSWTAVGSDLSAENLSRYGMTVRNLTALQALDVIWRAVVLPETGEAIEG